MIGTKPYQLRNLGKYNWFQKGVRGIVYGSNYANIILLDFIHIFV